MTTLPEPPPLSQSFLSAIPGGSDPKKPFVRIYYQGLDGHVYQKEFSDVDVAPRVPTVRGRSLELYSPAAVAVYKGEPFIYYLDGNNVIIEGIFLERGSHDQGPPEREPRDKPQTRLRVHDLNWLDVKAANFSKLSSIALDTKGVWVYYQSGRETGIREIWKQIQNVTDKKQQRHSEEVRFNVFSSELPNSVISGTGLASTIKGQGGGFVYQSRDYRIHYHLWDDKVFQWKDYNVLPEGAPTPAPKTNFAIAVDESNNTFIYYLTLDNKIARLLNHTGTSPAEWYYEPLDIIALPGSSLAAARYRIGVAISWIQMGSTGPEIGVKYDYVPRT